MNGYEVFAFVIGLFMFGMILYAVNRINKSPEKI